MIITILKSTVCGGVAVKPGDVVEASDRDAYYLIATKAAVHGGVVAEPPIKRGRPRSPVNRMIESGEIENRDAGE
jgi:hypothetical protein